MVPFVPLTNLDLANLKVICYNVVRQGVRIMRQEKFKMERQGLVEAGQSIKVTERVNGSLYSYVAEPSVAMSGIYRTTQRIKSKEGIIKEVRETDRGFYLIIEFDE